MCSKKTGSFLEKKHFIIRTRLTLRRSVMAVSFKNRSRPSTAGSRPSSAPSVLSPLQKHAPLPEEADPFETFCFMVVEEFLMRKRMTKTLESFRKEWHGKEDDMNVLTWYDVALKLHLDAIMQGPKHLSPSVLESMTGTLIQESSLRMRQQAEVTVKGLASIPRVKTNRVIKFKDSANIMEMSKDLNLHKASDSMLLISHSSDSGGSGSGPILFAPGDGGVGNVDVSKNAFGNVDTKKGIIASKVKKNSVFVSDVSSNTKTSVENWIPETNRLRSLHRHIAVAKETLGDILMRETGMERETRRFRRSDLEKAHDEERLGSKHLIQCACCFLSFSYVNLPLKVSNKALVDIRKKWSKGTTGGWWEKTDNKLNKIPRCYEESWVCLMCSQFFQDCEVYRPSFEKSLYDQKRTAFLEHKRREREYWDPLKMCEKDRDEAKRAGLIDEYGAPLMQVSVQASASCNTL